MHNCLVVDVRLAGMLDTHLFFISPLCFIYPDCCNQTRGVQEQEIPDADHHNVKIPDVDHRNVKIPDAFYDMEIPEDQE